MAPEFEAAARELEPALRLVKVSTEAAPRLAADLGIQPSSAASAGAADRQAIAVDQGARPPALGSSVRFNEACPEGERR